MDNLIPSAADVGSLVGFPVRPGVDDLRAIISLNVIGLAEFYVVGMVVHLQFPCAEQ